MAGQYCGHSLAYLESRGHEPFLALRQPLVCLALWQCTSATDWSVAACRCHLTQIQLYTSYCYVVCTVDGGCSSVRLAAGKFEVPVECAP